MTRPIAVTLRIVLLVLLSAAGAAAAAGAQSGAQVDRLAWLSGCWSQPRANGGVEEHWMAPLGESMLGMSRTVVSGKTVEYEFLRIAVVNGTLAYVAAPSGQTETAFPLKTLEDGVVVFENPSHDFPQRVIYRRNADASVTARVEGTVDGKTRGQDFPYRRCGK
jgi:hypothetical protein